MKKSLGIGEFYRFWRKIRIYLVSHVAALILSPKVFYSMNNCSIWGHIPIHKYWPPILLLYLLHHKYETLEDILIQGLNRLMIKPPWKIFPHPAGISLFQFITGLQTHYTTNLSIYFQFLHISMLMANYTVKYKTYFTTLNRFIMLSLEFIMPCCKFCMVYKKKTFAIL